MSVRQEKIHCKIHYIEMFVGRYIYEGCTVMSIVLITVMIVTKLFNLTLIHSLVRYYFITYLSLPNRFEVFPLQVKGFQGVLAMLIYHNDGRR